MAHIHLVAGHMIITGRLVSLLGLSILLFKSVGEQQACFEDYIGTGFFYLTNKHKVDVCLLSSS